MHKLKLESLQVESFETTRMGHRGEGTVRGHADVATGGTGTIQPATINSICIPTYNVRDCGDTRYFDCTFGCSHNTGCRTVCYIEADTPACAVE